VKMEFGKRSNKERVWEIVRVGESHEMAREKCMDCERWHRGGIRFAQSLANRVQSGCHVGS